MTTSESISSEHAHKLISNKEMIPKNITQQERNSKVLFIFLFYLISDLHAIAVNGARLRVAERQLRQIKSDQKKLESERRTLEFRIQWFRDIAITLKTK